MSLQGSKFCSLDFDYSISEKSICYLYHSVEQHTISQLYWHLLDCFKSITHFFSFKSWYFKDHAFMYANDTFDESDVQALIPTSGLNDRKESEEWGNVAFYKLYFNNKPSSCTKSVRPWHLASGDNYYFLNFKTCHLYQQTVFCRVVLGLSRCNAVFIKQISKQSSVCIFNDHHQLFYLLGGEGRGKEYSIYCNSQLRLDVLFYLFIYLIHNVKLFIFLH